MREVPVQCQMSALKIRDNARCGCILVCTRHWKQRVCSSARKPTQTHTNTDKHNHSSHMQTHTFAWVVLRRDDVLIPDYLLCWIKGHLVKLLNLRDSALMTGYLCVCSKQRETQRGQRHRRRESGLMNKCPAAPLAHCLGSLSSLLLEDGSGNKEKKHFHKIRSLDKPVTS